jgi:RNA polymerase sigma-70 factor (ECF subfamily)
VEEAVEVGASSDTIADAFLAIRRSMSATGTIPPDSATREQRWRSYLERIRMGDSPSLEALYAETSPILYALAYRVLNDREDAEEVILDVYHQIWKSPERYDASLGSVWGWLTVMTRHRAIDRLRKSNLRRTRELAITEPEETACENPAPETQSIFAQERAMVRQAMATLGRDQRQAIELAFFSGLTHSEVADTLGAPLGTIKTRIRVGIQNLRKALPADVWAMKS